MQENATSEFRGRSFYGIQMQLIDKGYCPNDACHPCHIAPLLLQVLLHAALRGAYPRNLTLRYVQLQGNQSQG